MQEINHEDSEQDEVDGAMQKRRNMGQLKQCTVLCTQIILTNHFSVW